MKIRQLWLARRRRCRPKLFLVAQHRVEAKRKDTPKETEDGLALGITPNEEAIFFGSPQIKHGVIPQLPNSYNYFEFEFLRHYVDCPPKSRPPKEPGCPFPYRVSSNSVILLAFRLTTHRQLCRLH